VAPILSRNLLVALHMVTIRTSEGDVELLERLFLVEAERAAAAAVRTSLGAP